MEYWIIKESIWWIALSRTNIEPSISERRSWKRIITHIKLTELHNICSWWHFFNSYKTLENKTIPFFFLQMVEFKRVWFARYVARVGWNCKLHYPKMICRRILPKPVKYIKYVLSYSDMNKAGCLVAKRIQKKNKCSRHNYSGINAGVNTV